MGFRSTFVTEDYPIRWPDWFLEKYKGRVHFPPENTGPISSVREAKTYMFWENLHADIQKSIDWEDFYFDSFILVYLHECGGITRCQIMKDKILWSEPETWKKEEGVTHDYCYGCSDAVSARGKEISLEDI